MAAVSTGAEGNLLVTNANFNVCGAQSEFVSGTLKQFAGAYRHSDIVVMTSLSDVVDLSLKDIARDLALQMDTHIRNQISGSGRTLFVAGTSAATSGLTNFSIIRSTSFLKAATVLDQANNPRPAGGHYPAVIHPAQQYDIQSTLSGNAWFTIHQYKGDAEPEELYRAELGRMFGCALTTSTNVKQILGNAAGKQLGGVGACVSKSSGWVDMVFAPEPYYVTEISDMTAKTYVKQLGSAGAMDPVNTMATVGAKVFFTAVPANWASSSGSTANSEVRMVRIIAGGKTV